MKTPCKGSLLQLSIASIYTTVAQLISLDGPEPEVETYDATTLDTVGAGKEYEPTGYAEPGEMSFEYFLDPALAIHKFLTTLVTTPQVASWKLVFADTATTEWPFDGIFKGGGPTVDMGDGLKASGGIQLDQLPTYPT